jgi:hypothetical protein
MRASRLWIPAAIFLSIRLCFDAGAAPTTHPGWPSAAGINMAAPISADLDGDGKQELLWGERFKLMVRYEDGRLFPGWPRSFMETAGGPPSVTSDGAPIIGIYSTDFNAGRGQVSLWRANGVPLPGWPKTFDSGNIGGLPRSMSIVFADIDGDGQPEVIYVSSTATDRSGTGVVHVDRLDGTALAGWPVTLPGAHDIIHEGAPAIADVDGDGRLDIAVVTDDQKIYLYHDNGVPFAGWPVTQGSHFGFNSVSFADINGDAQLELVVTAGEGIIGVYDSTGHVLPGWPKTTPEYLSPPTFADFENDGRLQVTNNDAKLEMGFATTSHAFIFRADGTYFPGWPKTLSTGTLALVDLDSDQKVDVFTAGPDRKVYAWDSAGNDLTALGFPFQISGTSGFNFAPSVADIDGDGLIEFFGLGDGRIQVFDLPTTFNPFLMRSPGPVGGNEHTSRYAPRPTTYTMEKPVYAYTNSATDFTVYGTGFLKGMRAFIGDREQTVSNVTATTLTVTADNVPIPFGEFALYPLRVENVNSGSSVPLIDAVWVWRSTSTPPPTPTPTVSPTATPRPVHSVYSQSPARAGGAGSDGVQTTVADDFQLDQDAAITRIRWWGSYVNPPPVPDTFTLRIFADDGGTPGALIRTLDIRSVNASRTGANSGNQAEYEYWADLRTPFSARAGVRYWFSIVNPPGSVWTWEVSREHGIAGSRRSFADSVNGAWQSYDLDMAFQLESTSGGLGNISTRGQVGTGDNALIAGFIVTGSDRTRVLVRALGPSLTAYGVAGALADPIVVLKDSAGVTVATNNDWKISVTGDAEVKATGAAPTDDRESAVVATLDPNKSYTVLVYGLAQGTGTAVAEVYDLDHGTVARLANISTRGPVQSGDGVMISGFIVRNPSGRVLVRGIGPSLKSFGVSNALRDPSLELHDGNGVLLASNDNWRSDQEAEIIATKAAPSDDLEAAIVKQLPGGAYTVIIRGATGDAGIGLIDVYDLE